MLQMIGWALCAWMFAHGFSMFGSAQYRVRDAEGDLKMTGAGMLAAGLLIMASVAFALWFYIQGTPELSSYGYDRVSAVQSSGGRGS